MTTTAAPRLHRTIGPTSQPLSVADAKKQLEVAADDTAHDTHFTALIVAAREQFERDTPWVTTEQTFELLLDEFPVGDRIPFPVKPVTSVT